MPDEQDSGVGGLVPPALLSRLEERIREDLDESPPTRDSGILRREIAEGGCRAAGGGGAPAALPARSGAPAGDPPGACPPRRARGLARGNTPGPRPGAGGGATASAI